MVARLVAATAIALLLASSGARAEERLVDEALTRFEQGDYEQVVAGLKDAVDAGGGSIRDVADRALALRVYGIACTLTGRRLAAEAAFLRWLALEPRARLDATLVRPEVVGFFEEVRQRHRAELLREVERRRPRNPALNLLPPAGQYQNGQRAKFLVVGALELATGALSLGTGLTLVTQVHGDKSFDASVHAEQLQTINWISFGVFVSVVAYGIVDGFAVYARNRRNYQLDEESLRADAKPAGPSLRPTANGLALAF